MVGLNVSESSVVAALKNVLDARTGEFSNLADFIFCRRAFEGAASAFRKATMKPWQCSAGHFSTGECPAGPNSHLHVPPCHLKLQKNIPGFRFRGIFRSLLLQDDPVVFVWLGASTFN